MLSVESMFPHPGSHAIWRGQRCRILQSNADGTTLVAIDSGHRRVPPEELIDPARVHLKPFGRWIERRVMRPRRADDFIATKALQDDYAKWRAIEDLPEEPIDAARFTRMMMDAGFERQTFPWRPFFNAVPTLTRGFRATFRS